MKLRYTLLVLLGLGFCGCTTSHDLELSSIDSAMVSYFKDHKETDRIELTKDSAKLTSTLELLESHREGWKRYYVTVAPGNVMISTANCRMNIGNNWVILNFTTKDGRYRQLTKSVNTDEFDYLKKKNP